MILCVSWLVRLQKKKRFGISREGGGRSGRGCCFSMNSTSHRGPSSDKASSSRRKAGSWLPLRDPFFLLFMATLLLLHPRLVPRSSAFIAQKGVGAQFVRRLGGMAEALSASPRSVTWAATNPLLDHVQSIKGIGPSTAIALQRLQISSIFDLLLHLPVDVKDWRQVTLVKDIQEGDVVTVAVRVKGHTLGGGKRPLMVHCEDEEGSLIDLAFFGSNYAWTLKGYPPGVQRVVRGKATMSRYNSRWQITQPETSKPSRGSTQESLFIEPVYRLTVGLKPTKLRDLIREVLRGLPDLPDWLDEDLRTEKQWPSFVEALQTVHYPTSHGDLHPRSKARERLAFDELLAKQLPMAIRRASQSLGLEGGAGSEASDGPVRSIIGDGYLIDPCIASLPFQLTRCQSRSLNDIWRDMASTQWRMERLLQGDVGSGKTVCALLAMLRAVEAGCQAALLIPTEILAHQHNATLTNMCQGLQVKTPEGGERPVRIEVLTSGTKKGKARKMLLEEVKNGDIDILIGTHSLLSDELLFRDLGLVVVDEEHRFGVEQRDKLSNETNVLFMSATPIPRTLQLAHYPDLEMSRLEEAPHKSGVEVMTSVMSLCKLDEVMEGVRRVVVDIGAGDKVFWVLPRIEDKEPRQSSGISETEEQAVLPSTEGVVNSVTSVIHRYRTLVDILGEDKVRMVHGKLDSESKLKALQEFSQGEVDVLVTTSVIEVGVDVPDATVCIVEHADMFGLSQLHQLRGRIGRSGKGIATGRSEEREGAGGEEGSASTSSEKGQDVRRCHCVLLFDEASPSGDKSKQRLCVMKQTTDGFKIAEQDLRHRGPGDPLGSKQTGFKPFRVADLRMHEDLLLEAHEVAKEHALRLVNAQQQAQDDDEDELEGEIGEYQRASSSSSAASEILLSLFGRRNEQQPVVTKRTRAPRTKITKSVATKQQAAESMVTVSAASGGGTATITSSSRSSTVTVTSSGGLSEVEIYSPLEEERLAKEAAAAATTGRGTRTAMVPLIAPNTKLPYNLESEDLLFILVDTETTGVHNSDRVIQMAGKVYIPEEDTVEWRDELMFTSYTNPGVFVPSEASKVHGITQEVLMAEARPFGEVWVDFVDWVKDVSGDRPVMFVAHNAKFDRDFFLRELARAGMTDRELRNEAKVVGIVDTLGILKSDLMWSQWDGDGRPPKPDTFRQGELYNYLYEEDAMAAHTALGDVRSLAKILAHPAMKDRWRAVGSRYVWALGNDDQEDVEVDNHASLRRGAVGRVAVTTVTTSSSSSSSIVTTKKDSWRKAKPPSTATGGAGGGGRRASKEKVS